MKKYNYVIFLILSFMILSMDAYSRTFCNYGTAPIKITMHFAGGPICGDREEVIPNTTNANKACYTFDTGGCCITGVTIKGGSGYPEKYFPLDNSDFNPRDLFRAGFIDNPEIYLKLDTTIPGLQDFQSTGFNMACKDTLFTFWNDTTNKIFSSVGSAKKDYMNLAQAKKVQSVLENSAAQIQEVFKRAQQAAQQK